MTITNEKMEELLAGLEGLPIGPYSAHDYEADLLDGKGRWMELDHGSAIWHHFARCDPDTIRSLITRLQASEAREKALREALERIAKQPEKYEDEARSYGIGFAFHLVQNIARLVLTDQEPGRAAQGDKP